MCQKFEEVFDQIVQETKAKEAQKLAFKMAARGDSIAEIADLLEYAPETIEKWLQEEKQAFRPMDFLKTSQKRKQTTF